MIERLGESGGFEVKRLTLDSPERDELYDITDPNICACVLCGYLSRSRKTFCKTCGIRSVFRRFQPRDVDCDGDKFEIMRKLSESKGEKELIEGNTFHRPRKGLERARRSKNDLKGFRVVAEAASSETAEEICDFDLKKIRSDKK